MTTKTVSDAFESYTAEVMPRATPDQITDAKLRFYSGVLAAVTLLYNGSSPEGLMSELLAYGRQIGRN